jgi:hypothetical protein
VEADTIIAGASASWIALAEASERIREMKSDLGVPLLQPDHASVSPIIAASNGGSQNLSLSPDRGQHAHDDLSPVQIILGYSVMQAEVKNSGFCN